MLRHCMSTSMLIICFLYMKHEGSKCFKMLARAGSPEHILNMLRFLRLLTELEPGCPHMHVYAIASMTDIYDLVSQ